MASTTVNLTGNPDIDGILSGLRWSGNTVSYGFPTDKADYGDYSHLVDHDNNKATPALQIDETNGFSALSDDQQKAAHAAFGEFARFTLSSAFQQTPANDADVRLGQSSAMAPRPDGSPADAYASYPGASGLAGDVWFNPTAYNNPLLGTRAYQTFFHEIGHALGLKHGHIADNGNGMVLPADRDSLEFSTMTYRDYVGQDVADGQTVAEGSAPQTFMMFDIAALQYMYGADFDIYAGNTTYRFDPSSGQTFIDSVGQGVPKAQDGSNSNVLFRTLWDGNGYDTYDFSAYTSNLDLDLAPGGWTDVDSVGTLQAANLGSNSAKEVQYARGQVFNALLVNGDTRSLIENAIGGVGSDHLRGNQADNWLRGGDGNDVLEGFDGNDTLDQGDTFIFGLDSDRGMYGGNDNDTLWASASADLIDGGNDFDIVNYSRSSARVVIDLSAGKVTQGDAAGDTLISIEGIVGTAFNDFITFGDGDNFISGGLGNDTLAGGGGADSMYGSEGGDELRGGLGGDLLDGGAGADTASFESAVVINLATGIHTGEAAGDRFFSIEHYRGSAGADIMIASSSAGARFSGGDGNDSLIGSDRDDWLQGGKGEDRLAGGGGFDMVSYADAPNRIVADLSQRDATSQGKITAGAWGPDVLTSIEDVEGTSFNDTLLGDDGSNRLVGLAGADFINGRQGIDFLLGGEGNDTVVCSEGDFAYGGGGWDSISFDGGAAFVNVASELFLVGGLGFYMTEFEAYVGGSDADSISGADFAESFSGGAGNDVLRGQGGDDLMLVDAGADVLDCGAGRDTIVFSRAMVADWQAGVLDADIAADTWTAWEVIQGSSGADRIRTNSWGYDVELRGGAGDDVLASGDGSDTLVGEEGDDTLTAGAGADAVLGGAGNDTLADLAERLNGDRFIDFAMGDQILVSDLRFAASRYTRDTGLLELDSRADGSFATSLFLSTGLAGEFRASASGAAEAASTRVQLMLDTDGDGVGDFRDNAILVANADQRDSDGDGYGNVVDADLNQDLVIDLFDLSLLDQRFGGNDADADFNGDASVDLYDLSILDALFGGPPGRSYIDQPVVAAEGLSELFVAADFAAAQMPPVDHGHHMFN